MPPETQLLQNGRYQINNQIPLNGQTAIYEAYDTVRNVKVVVKEIVVHLNKVTTPAQQEQMRLAFANQAKVLTDVKHDSLLQVVDYFSEIGRQYLVIEAVEGDCLADTADSGGLSFASADVVKWADQLLDAVGYLHNHTPTVIHGSIRPQNIKLTGEGRIKLLDVGLPDGAGNKLSTSIFAQSVDTEISYSPLEQIWGSLDSASQKVITNSFDDANARGLNEPLGPKSDIYSLSATLYHLLTGRKPVDALERAIDLLDGKPDPLKPVNELAPEVEPELSDVVMKGMSVKISDRFETVSMMRQVIKTAIVRATERKAEEDREHAEAAEVLRNATPRIRASAMNFKQAAPVTPVAPPVHDNSADSAQAELLAQKLREAEEQRMLAEKRAAEAERQLWEKEAAMARVSAPIIPVLESDLLEIPLGPAGIPSVPQVRETEAPPVIEAVPNAIPETVEQPTEAHHYVSEPEAEEEIAVESAEVEVDVSIIETPGDEATPAKEDSSQEYANDDFSIGDSYGTAKLSAIPMSAVAGGGALLVVLLAIGGWFLMASPGEKQAETAPPTTVTQPVVDPAQAPVVQEQPAESELNAAANEPQASPETISATPEQAPPIPARTPTKPTPQPQATPARRAVTVDDLINDN